MRYEILLDSNSNFYGDNRRHSDSVKCLNDFEDKLELDYEIQ